MGKIHNFFNHSNLEITSEAQICKYSLSFSVRNSMLYGANVQDLIHVPEAKITAITTTD